MTEALNATMFAFRRREPGGVLLRASIAFIICAIVLLALFALVFWGALLSVANWYVQVFSAAVSGDNMAAVNIGFPMGLFALLPGFLLWLFFFYLLFAAYEAACLRWMIHGETQGFWGLSLGAPTWRVYSGYWVWYGLYLAASVALSIVMVAVMSVLAIGGAAAGAQASDAGALALSFGLALTLLYILFYGTLAYFGVRLAPAAATSIARRKFSFFHAWNVTKGRFWALFGSFLILCLLYCAFVLVFGAVMIGAIFAAAGAGVNWATGPEENAAAMMEGLVRAIQQPRTWIVLAGFQIVGMACAMLFYIAMFGVNARAALAALEEHKIAMPPV